MISEFEVIFTDSEMVENDTDWGINLVTYFQLSVW